MFPWQLAPAVVVVRSVDVVVEGRGRRLLRPPSPPAPSTATAAEVAVVDMILTLVITMDTHCKKLCTKGFASSRCVVNRDAHVTSRNSPIQKVTCSHETLASRYGDLVSPSTRPREFGISVKSIASSICPRTPCIRTHRKYQTQRAPSMLNNKNKQKTLVLWQGETEISSRQARETAGRLGISTRSIGSFQLHPCFAGRSPHTETVEG